MVQADKREWLRSIGLDDMVIDFDNRFGSNSCAVKQGGKYKVYAKGSYVRTVCSEQEAFEYLKDWYSKTLARKRMKRKWGSV